MTRFPKNDILLSNLLDMSNIIQIFFLKLINALDFNSIISNLEKNLIKIKFYFKIHYTLINYTKLINSLYK